MDDAQLVHGDVEFGVPPRRAGADVLAGIADQRRVVRQLLALGVQLGAVALGYAMRSVLITGSEESLRPMVNSGQLKLDGVGAALRDRGALRPGGEGHGREDPSVRPAPLP
ncbi:hypothetical protein GCM10009738_41860 [Kitasatospora viridis]